MIPLKIKLLTATAKAPSRGHATSAGLDLFADVILSIKPGEVRAIGLGFSAEFPPGYVALLWDRSSLGSKGVHRFAGVIDSDYRGEWMVCLFNSTKELFRVNTGDKIVHVLFQPIELMDITITKHLTSTERGAGGFEDDKLNLLVERIKTRCQSGREQNMKNYRTIRALDLIWDAPYRQVHQHTMNKHLIISAIASVIMLSWLLLLCWVTRKK